MGNFDRNVFSSRSQEYSTPQGLFDLLNDEFHFTLDVCADDRNHKVDKYYTQEDNGLSKSWHGVCWMNPPYKNKRKWVIKAYEEATKNNCVVVCLVPARTNTNWWHDYCQKGEIRFVRGRPTFEGMKHGLPQPLAIVIFGSNHKGNYKSVEFR